MKNISVLWEIVEGTSNSSLIKKIKVFKKKKFPKMEL